MATQVATSLYNRLADEFQARQTQQKGKENEQVTALREKAFRFFKEKGFPSIREEDWRFTNLVPFLDTPYNIQAQTADEQQLRTAIENNLIPGLDAYRLVLVNGSIHTGFSQFPDEKLITIQPLSSVRDSTVFQEQLGSHDHTGATALVALNAALFTDGYFIEVKANAVIDKPILVLHLYIAPDDALFQPRHLVIVNKNAKAELIEVNVTLKGDKAVFTNSVAQTVVKENAHFTQYFIQDNGRNERWVNYHHVTQQRDSHYANYTFSLPDADLIRNNLNIVLDGSNTETHMNGLYLVGEHQLTDNHTSIEHRYPNCESHELYKGVLMGNGKAVFNGKVYVEQEAQKTNAYQQNNNLLLSDKAQVFAKPQLEIFADDVKCSHGCTIGQFNQESLFYLQARGIGEETARNLLVEAFAFDVTDKIDNEAVKEHLQGLIHKKMTPATAH